MPAACAASPVGFVAREIMLKILLFVCLPRTSARPNRTDVIMRPEFGTTWRSAADVKAVHDHLSRFHAGAIAKRDHFDLPRGLRKSMPAEQKGQSAVCPSVCRSLPHRPGRTVR